MTDLAITESGDLLFIEDEEKNKDFKVSFNLSTGKSLKVSFKINNSEKIKKSTSNDLLITFKLQQIKNNKKALIVSDNNALPQQIRFRLLTSLNEIKERKNLGSKLELIKHQQLYDKSVQSKAALAIKQSIKDILPNAVIKIRPVISNTFGYSQSLCAYIYNNNKIIYKHFL